MKFGMEEVPVVQEKTIPVPATGSDSSQKMQRAQTTKKQSIDEPKEQKSHFSFLKRPSISVQQGEQGEESKGIFGFMRRPSIQTEVSAAEVGEQPKGLFSFKKRPSIAPTPQPAGDDQPEHKSLFSFKKRGSLSAAQPDQQQGVSEEHKTLFSFKKRPSMAGASQAEDLKAFNQKRNSSISGAEKGEESGFKGRSLSKKRPSVSKPSANEDEEEFKGRFSFKRNPSISSSSHHEDTNEKGNRFSFKPNRASMSPPKKGAALQPRSSSEELIDSDIMALWEIMGNTIIPLEKDLLEASKSSESINETTSKITEMKRYLKQLNATEEEKEVKPNKSKRQSFFAGSKQDAARILEAI